MAKSLVNALYTKLFNLRYESFENKEWKKYCNYIFQFLR